MIAAVLLVLALALPVVLVGVWGWFYGALDHASGLGLLLRTVVAVVAGSWTFGVSVGHGVGFGPLAALLCGMYDIDTPSFDCVPPYWVTPVACLAAFAGMAMFAAIKARRSSSTPD